MTLKIGDRVRYTGPQLLGQPFVGTIERLPTPHTHKGQKRRATDDMVLVRTAVSDTSKHPVRPVRVNHLEVIR